MHLRENPPAIMSIHTGDHSEILRMHDLKYKAVDQYYLQVGEISMVQGWILHISVIKTQLAKVLMVLVSELDRERVPFKIIHNEEFGIQDRGIMYFPMWHAIPDTLRLPLLAVHQTVTPLIRA